MKTATIELPYYKKGDDMASCLKNQQNDVLKAIDEHSEWMACSAGILMSLKEEIEKFVGESDKIKDISIEADTHMIWLSGPDELIDLLVEKELVELEPDFDDEDEDDEEFEDDDLAEDYDNDDDDDDDDDEDKQE